MLQPYMGELVHFDCAERGREPNRKWEFERVRFRAGHMLVYEMLRTDPVDKRRARIADGLSHLLVDQDDSLGRISMMVSEWDIPAVEEKPWPDRQLRPHDPDERGSNWQSLMRSGVDRILADQVSPIPKKIDHLMYWIPFCLAKHMLARAFDSMGLDVPVVPVDMGAEGELRRHAQDRLLRDRNSLEEAVLHAATLEPETPKSIRLQNRDYSPKGQPSTTIESMADWYRATMADIGALNHNSKKSFYTIKLNLLETIVYAMIDMGKTRSFDSFCSEILFDELGMLVDPSGGQKARSAAWVDNEELEVNKKALADRLEALGLITSFSDATRMVGPIR
jgi:hypothetical protein